MIMQLNRGQHNTSYRHIIVLCCLDKCENILFSSVSAMDSVHTCTCTLLLTTLMHLCHNVSWISDTRRVPHKNNLT